MLDFIAFVGVDFRCHWINLPGSHGTDNLGLTVLDISLGHHLGQGDVGATELGSSSLGHSRHGDILIWCTKKKVWRFVFVLFSSSGIL